MAIRWMKICSNYVLLLVLTVVINTTGTSAIPPRILKSRVLDVPISEQEHYADDKHNLDFDHEAFLGKEEVKAFADLTPDESKDRLKIIYDKIDRDRNNQLTEEELSDWVQYVQTRYIRLDTDRQWVNYAGSSNATTLTWEFYKDRTYGGIPPDEEELDDGENRGYDYKKMVKRDEQRWSKADRNRDGSLTKDEFQDFLHPEESANLKDIIVDETLEDIDKDKDGYISLEEYMRDMWPGEGVEKEEPDWVRTEREQFAESRDRNQDGRMDRDEVRNWIMPDDYNHSKAEARHLIYMADADKNGVLSKDEVVEKYDVFVGSQATDFGEALRKHDEF